MIIGIIAGCISTLVIMETYDRIAWRRNGGMNQNRHHTPVTSSGRKIIVTAHREPLKGEIYLKPSGVKGIYNVLMAENDFAKNYYSIIGIVSDESEYRAKKEEQRRKYPGKS